MLNSNIKHFQKISWQLPDDCLTIARWLLDNCLMTARQMPNDYLMTTMTAWWLPDDCLTTTWWLPDNYLTTLDDNLLMTARWQPAVITIVPNETMILLKIGGRKDDKFTGIWGWFFKQVKNLNSTISELPKSDQI